MDDNAPITIHVGAAEYLVWPIAALDANFATCPPHHRDALLDARLLAMDTRDAMQGQN